MGMKADHVKIGSYWYRLAESAEGTHYQLSYPPQRSPNAVVVKGEEPGAQRFQTRPDIELWSITDWSGGEGRYKYDNQSPNQHAILYGLDPFSVPGTVRPCGLIERTQDSVGVLSDDYYTLIVFNGTLYAFNTDLTGNSGLKYRTWNTSTKQWSALSAAIGTVPTTGTVISSMVTDHSNLYFAVLSGQVYRWSGSGAAVAVTTGVSASAHWQLSEMGNYLYVIGSSVIYEILKTAAGGSVTTLLSVPAVADITDNRHGSVTRADNKLYAMWPRATETLVYEVVPSTAAGAGYAYEKLRVTGAAGKCLWFHNGIVHMATTDPSDDTSRTLYYWVPDQELGTLGRISDPLINSVAGNARLGQDQNNSDLASAFLLAEDTLFSVQQLYQVDAITNGLARLGSLAFGGDGVIGPIWFDGSWFWTYESGGVGRIYWIDPATANHYEVLLTENSYFVTPYYDFGLAEEKVLSSVRVVTEPLPANWTIKVEYSTGGSYTSMGSLGTTSAVSLIFPGSTSSAPVLFNQLRLRVTFVWGGAGEPATFPVINAVEVRSQLATHARRWTLLVDLNDELSNGLDGARKIANLKTLAQSETVVAFEDNYIVRQGAGEASISAIIDDLDIIVSRPGEGLAKVVLTEVFDS
jgi:hypothetical protein